MSYRLRKWVRWYGRQWVRSFKEEEPILSFAIRIRLLLINVTILFGALILCIAIELWRRP